LKNLGDSIIFSLSVVTFIIGVHQTMTFGIGNAYFIFMVSMGLLFLYRYRIAKGKEQEKVEEAKKPKSKRANKR